MFDLGVHGPLIGLIITSLVESTHLPNSLFGG